MGIDKTSKKYLQQANIKTHTQISYDSKGVVIRGYDATTDDILESATRKYVTSSQLTAIQNTSGINTGDQDLSGLLEKVNNLSDLTDVNIARNNLGLGSLATQSGTFSGMSSGINTGDNAVNLLYNRLVTNAYHTGDVIGDTAITVLGINGVMLSTLGTGILKLTSGIPSIATVSDFPNGIPIGGTAGQVLAKIDGTDYNTHWITGGGGGGSGDALTTDPLSQFAATTKVQLNSVISDGTPMYVGDAPTSHTHVKADITDFGTYSTDIHSNITALNLVSGTNTGDQISIVGITGIKTQFNTALTDGDFMFVGDSPTIHTHVIADITDFGTYSTDIHANITALNAVSGVNTGDQSSIVGIMGTKAQFNTAVTDGDILFTNDITGTPDGTKFLRDDYSWAVPPSSGSKSVNNISVNTNAGSTSGIDYYYLCDGTITLTLPTAIGNTSKYTIKNVGTGVITIDTALSQLIDGWDQVTISFKNNSLDIISDGTNYRIT